MGITLFAIDGPDNLAQSTSTCGLALEPFLIVFLKHFYEYVKAMDGAGRIGRKKRFDYTVL